MTTARINLTDAQRDKLRVLSEATGKTPDQLLQEAVQQFLATAHRRDRLALLRQAKGMWKGRKDLPDWKRLRSELDRS